jgi:hypothetical protein
VVVDTSDEVRLDYKNKGGGFMRLQEVLNKFSNSDFLLTVNGWCDELPFWEYPEEQKQAYWSKYKDKKVVGFSLHMTNEQPELCIRIED